ncbi:NAD(P)/FAD-dependent oxidoreductase [Aestuariivirga sp.]|uniref:NAD(P)/FAD-dependent oxidoreductase n=1 Tax=Aestuariivirga sp. TaxID=2650926 RepID=UPI003BAAC5CE
MIDANYSDRTWYEATAERGPLRPELSGRVEADNCVIGGGLAGLTTALELARRGQSVVLLEARRIAWGASGRNGGFVSNGFAEGMGNVAKRVGLEAAQALYQLSRHGTEFVRREIAETDPSIKAGEGWQGCIRYSNAAAKQAAVAEMARDYGQEMQFFDVAETRARVNTLRYFQSSYDPTAFHMHPLRYSLMLAKKAEIAGARIFENSPAANVERQGAVWVVRTAQGEVRAANVVYCMSSLDRTLHKPTGRAVLPVATYVAVTEPLTQDVIRTRSAISDTRRAGNYYRLVGEGRLLWGGAITTRVSEPRRLAERMKGDMISVFPELGNPRIDYAWSGLMGYAPHFMPLIGSDGQGQWWATAFGGHGMNTTAMGGILLSRAIAAKDDEFRRFEPFGPQWAGGPFGRAGVQAGYWYMQLKDRLDERRYGRAA